MLNTTGKVTDRNAEKQVVELLVTPLEKFGLKEVLGMPAFPRLMGLLQDATLRELSVTICKTMLRLQTPMTCVADMEQLFLLISQLLQDQPGGDPIEDDEVPPRPPYSPVQRASSASTAPETRQRATYPHFILFWLFYKCHVPLQP